MLLLGSCLGICGGGQAFVSCPGRFCNHAESGAMHRDRTHSELARPKITAFAATSFLQIPKSYMLIELISSSACNTVIVWGYFSIKARFPKSPMFLFSSHCERSGICLHNTPNYRV